MADHQFLTNKNLFYTPEVLVELLKQQFASFENKHQHVGRFLWKKNCIFFNNLKTIFFKKRMHIVGKLER